MRDGRSEARAALAPCRDAVSAAGAFSLVRIGLWRRRQRNRFAAGRGAAEACGRGVARSGNLREMARDIPDFTSRCRAARLPPWWPAVTIRPPQQCG